MDAKREKSKEWVQEASEKVEKGQILLITPKEKETDTT